MARTSEKRDADAHAARQNQLTLRCGDCLHFNGTAHPSYGQPCSKIGVKTYATAPSCYSPNVQVFRKTGPDTFATLASILSTFSPQQSRILMGLLKSAGSLEKFGYTFLEKVYFRAGEDFLDNYYYGHVLGVGLNGTLAVVGASFFTSPKNPLVAYLLPESVFGYELFKKKRARLTRTGMLYAPRKPQKNVITDDYEPPTMETAPEVLEKLALKNFGGKKKKPPRVANEDGTLEVKLNRPEAPTKKPSKSSALPRDEDPVDDDELEEDLED